MLGRAALAFQGHLNHRAVSGWARIPQGRDWALCHLARLMGSIPRLWRPTGQIGLSGALCSIAQELGATSVWGLGVFSRSCWLWGQAREGKPET